MADTRAERGPWRRRSARPALALGLVASLAACAEGSGPAAPAGAAARTTELVETDVEAPEVFQVTESGLWDGRPSLGGVWVAHPDVTDPERVIIRNQETGAFVIGALFRRERENPGPALQVSSDAAEALAMLAGAPAPLNVTALRREEAAAPAPTAAAAPVGVPDEGVPPEAAPAAEAVPAVATAALAPAAVATTSLDAAPTTAPGPAVSAPADAAAIDAVARATAAILGQGATAAAAEPSDSTLDQPLIQLGIFSIEANAEATAAALVAEGLPARVAASTTQGADFWRVLVGPAATAADRDALLARVRAEGFDDAYAVRD